MAIYRPISSLDPRIPSGAGPESSRPRGAANAESDHCHTASRRTGPDGAHRDTVLWLLRLPIRRPERGARVRMSGRLKVTAQSAGSTSPCAPDRQPPSCFAVSLPPQASARDLATPRRPRLGSESPAGQRQSPSPSPQRRPARLRPDPAARRPRIRSRRLRLIPHPAAARPARPRRPWAVWPPSRPGYVRRAARA